MKKLYFFLCLLFIGCQNQPNVPTAKIAINKTLNQWHKAAAEANFDTYFSLMTKEGVFIGTDPTENWQNQAFRTFSKPYFDKKKAWNLTAIQRNIYVDANEKTAWFDELLSTQMKICRGSGVLIKQNNNWKIAHYVLSIAIPNENTTEVVKLKTTFDDNLINQLKIQK